MIEDKSYKKKQQQYDGKQQQQKLLSNITSNNNKYYRPSDINTGCCCSRFDLRFQQMINSYINKGFLAKAQALYKRLQYKNLSDPKDLIQLEQKLPINFHPNFSCQQDKIRFTWIGHATAVISIGNQANIIIDPVFSERCSPFKFIGPKRYRAVPCTIKQLPKIDIVLVSHDHYDHCDRDSINQIQKLFKPYFFAGLQSQDLFPQNCKLYQLDWTQTKKILVNGNQFEITFIPTCHWSRRGLTDMCKRLWGGFVIKTPKGDNIFYSGDSGYCQIFKQIGQRFKQFKLCIFPIGSYQPRQLLKNQHMNPQDAVLCHLDLNSKKSVGVHWGTFSLGRQHWNGGRQDLQIAKLKYRIEKDQFMTVGHGSSFQIDYLQQSISN